MSEPRVVDYERVLCRCGCGRQAPIALGHNDAAERARLVARVEVAALRVQDFGGDGYAVALDMAQRALAVFERAHPDGRIGPHPSGAALPEGTPEART